MLTRGPWPDPPHFPRAYCRRLRLTPPRRSLSGILGNIFWPHPHRSGLEGRCCLQTHFQSRDELLFALMASCTIPLVTHKASLMHYGGYDFYDGGFTRNWPALTQEKATIQTIYVSPFTGPEFHICPQQSVNSSSFGEEAAVKGTGATKQLNDMFPATLITQNHKVYVDADQVSRGITALFPDARDSLLRLSQDGEFRAHLGVIISKSACAAPHSAAVYRLAIPTHVSSYVMRYSYGKKNSIDNLFTSLTKLGSLSSE